MTAICDPCALAADADTARLELGQPALGHPAEVCRDFHIQPGGCPCQHQAPAMHPQEPRCTGLNR